MHGIVFSSVGKTKENIKKLYRCVCVCVYCRPLFLKKKRRVTAFWILLVHLFSFIPENIVHRLWLTHIRFKCDDTKICFPASFFSKSSFFFLCLECYEIFLRAVLYISEEWKFMFDRNIRRKILCYLEKVLFEIEFW